MPLIDANLQSDLATFLDGSLESEADCAQAWADAMESYVQTIVPTSTTAATAAGLLASGLAGMSVPDAAVGVFTSAMATFGSELASGMIPAAIPPSAPFILPLQDVDSPTSANAAAANISAAIGTWIRTGRQAPPSNAPWA